MTARTPLTAAALAAGLFLGSAAAWAGPPLICHPVEIGDAKSLPWGSGAFDRSRRYRLSSLVDDTVRILENDQSALVHVETLRRATLYVDDHPDTAVRLLARLMARALDAEAAGAPDGLAWLDAGYLVQCYEQIGLRPELPCGSAKGVTGYAWVRRALELSGDDAEMEFAAAMVTALDRIPEHDQHAARARKLGADRKLVLRNLDVHATRYWPRHHRRRGAG